jgi:hypothetical protein
MPAKSRDGIDPSMPFGGMKNFLHATGKIVRESSVTGAVGRGRVDEPALGEEWLLSAWWS